MFNLEQAIEQWRRQLMAGGLNSAEALDELESHLRDDVAAQVRSGLDEERAFELAARRLGAPGAISREFAKAAPSVAPPRRRLLRYFYFVCATVAVLIDVWTLLSFEISPVERVGAALGVAVLAFYLFGLPFWAGWRGGVPRLCLLGGMKALGLIMPLWPLFALLTALRVIHVELGIIPEMIMWLLCVAFGLTGVGLALNQGWGGQSGAGGAFPPLVPVPWPIPPSRPGPPDFNPIVPPSAAFTETARRALEVAREEASSLGHDFVGTEHVLLGVLKTAGGALAQVLQRTRVNDDAVRAEVRRLIAGFPTRPGAAALPLTPRARQALQFACREAAASAHAPIGAEHILLGLLLEGGGVAAVALKNLGIRLERLRSEVLRG